MKSCCVGKFSLWTFIVLEIDKKLTLKQILTLEAWTLKFSTWMFLGTLKKYFDVCTKINDNALQKSLLKNFPFWLTKHFAPLSISCNVLKFFISSQIHFYYNPKVVNSLHFRFSDSDSESHNTYSRALNSPHLCFVNMPAPTTAVPLFYVLRLLGWVKAQVAKNPNKNLMPVVPYLMMFLFLF